MRKKLLILLSIIVISSFATLTNPFAKAQSSPAIVEVQVLLVDISKVNLAQSSYGLDFFLGFYFDPSKISMEEVKSYLFINSAVGEEPTLIDVLIEDEEQGIYSARVSGIFTGKFDFTDFPFETHSIELLLENKILNASIISYDASPESKMLDSIGVGGWNVGSLSVTTSEKLYFNDVFSQFKFTVDLTRPVGSTIVKVILPLIIFSIMAVLAFLISPENAGERITSIGLLLVTATGFHLAIVSSIPETSYLTFFDEIIIMMYLIFLYIFAESAIVKFLQERKQPERAKKIERRALRILPIIIILIVIIFIQFI